MLEKVRLFSTPTSIIIGRILNHKSPFWHVKISTNKTIIFNNKFKLIEQIKKQTTTEEKRTLLKRRENFWVLKLKTLYPDGLNQELKNTD